MYLDDVRRGVDSVDTVDTKWLCGVVKSFFVCYIGFIRLGF